MGIGLQSAPNSGAEKSLSPFMAQLPNVSHRIIIRQLHEFLSE